MFNVTVCKIPKNYQCKYSCCLVWEAGVRPGPVPQDSSCFTLEARNRQFSQFSFSQWNQQGTSGDQNDSSMTFLTFWTKQQGDRTNNLRDPSGEWTEGASFMCSLRAGDLLPRASVASHILQGALAHTRVVWRDRSGHVFSFSLANIY